MKRLSIRPLNVILMILFCGGIVYASVWDGGGPDNEYSTALNWDDDTVPVGGSAPEATREINTAVTVERVVNSTAGRTFVEGGATMNVTGGTHSDSRSGNTIRNYLGWGSVGTINQTGGTYNIGHILLVGGSNASGDGTYNLSGGSLAVSRGGNSLMSVPGGSSIEIGTGGGAGLLDITGGSLTTRIGVGVGATGIFRVQGSGASTIGIGSHGTLDGDWNQSAGGILSVGIDSTGVTKIFIDDENNDGGAYATFDSGALLDVDYYNAGSGGGTWTVLEVEGTNITNYGLGFAPGVDTNIWSFNVDNSGPNGLLTVTAAGPPPGRTAVVASSIADLQLYVGAHNHDVTMTPGTYQVTTADFGSGATYTSPHLFEFTGTNSVFDFTGVTFEVDTLVLQAFGGVDVRELYVIGNDLVLSNLTLIDIGKTVPSFRAQSIVLDGRRNRIEGFNVVTRGSYPYGYGDIFGKGGGPVISHKKHSAILVRGIQNHLKNTKLFHRSYGHGIFCQGSQDAIIEGCYVEGETRTSDDVLAEAGSGSAADNVAFMTTWGYTLQPGWMFSLQEAGIRAYNTGLSIDGVNSTNTTDITVIDCTVNKMRTGVNLGFCNDKKAVTNCVVIDVESGLWLGTEGEAVNFAGNSAYGPLLITANYQNDRDSIADITVLDNSNRYGNELLAYIAGSRDEVTFHCRDEYVDTNLVIKVAGLRTGIRQHIINPTYNNLTATDAELYNNTIFPVEMGTNSSGTTGWTAGSVVDYGSGNSLTPISVNTDGGFGVIQTIEAEAYSSQSGASIKTRGDGIRYIGAENDGDWLCFENFFFGSGPTDFEARVAGGDFDGDIELRLGSAGGTLIGTCSVSSNAGPHAWIAETVSLDEPRGKHDLYLVFKGVSGSLPELDRFRFYVTFPGWESSRGLVGHWKFDDGSGSIATDDSGYGHHGTMANATWVNGKKGGALDFNPASSTVTIPTSAFSSIREEITIAFWAYGDAAAQPANDSIFYAADGGDRELNIHLPYSNSQIFWDAGNEGGYNRINKTASAAEFEGSWAHWVFTKNSKTGNMRIYRNGAMWHHGAYLTKDISGITDAAIGSQIGGSLNYRGLVDDVRLYDIELMEHEVAALYTTYVYTDAGTPHSWLADHGLVTGGDYEAADFLDSDGDGLLNGGEFNAGTDPTNAASVLSIISADVSGGQMIFDWSAVAGKTYAVWQKDDLTDDIWCLQEDAIPGQVPTCTSTSQTVNAGGFIQVEVLPE